MATLQQPEEEDVSGFLNYLSVYCMTYERLEGAFEFQEKIIDHIKAVTAKTDRFDADKFLYHPGCIPQSIGGTRSPIIHLTAENATDRLAFLKALFKHHQKEGKVPWTKIVNAKNTRGQTVLDYLHYLNINKKLIIEEEKGVNDLYYFLCANGGEYSYYPKECTKEFIKIQLNR